MTLEDMARQAGIEPDNDLTGRAYVPAAAIARFAALVRADAEAEAHAAIDASQARIVRNRLQGYPGTEDRVLTLVERIAALDQYAADYKRWLLEAEAAAARVRADERERCAKVCEAQAERWPGSLEKHYAAHECAAAIRALKEQQ